jgi:WD40 repeat protein
MLVFQGPKQQAQCLAFVPGPAGQCIAAGYWGDLLIWPTTGGDPVELPLAPAEQLPGTSGLEELAVSPKGDWIAGRWFRGTRRWRRQRGQWVDAGIIPGNRSGLAFRNKELLLVYGIRWQETGEWVYEIARSLLIPPTAATLMQVTQPHPAGAVTNGGLAVLSPSTRLLATAAREKAAQIWDVRTGKHLGTLPQKGFVEAVAWSPSGETLALNAGVTIRLFDVKTLTEQVAWKVKYSYQPRMVFSPDGRTLTTTDTSAGVHLWDADSGHLRATLKAGRERRTSVAFAPDGLTIAAGGGDGSVVVWDV